VRPIKFRAAASADMRRIATDTRARWGHEQAAGYSAALRDAIKSLREYPLRFPEFEGPHKDLRRMNSGRHTVFYLITGDAIEIVRVLHTAMDFDERLG
jgi:toxin ParE1/3/4